MLSGDPAVASPPSKLRTGAVCIMRERLEAAKRRKLTEPFINCYTPYTSVIIWMDGLEQVGVSECVIAD